MFGTWDGSGTIGGRFCIASCTGSSFCGLLRIILLEGWGLIWLDLMNVVHDIQLPCTTVCTVERLDTRSGNLRDSYPAIFLNSMLSFCNDTMARLQRDWCLMIVSLFLFRILRCRFSLGVDHLFRKSPSWINNRIVKSKNGRQNKVQEENHQQLRSQENPDVSATFNTKKTTRYGLHLTHLRHFYETTTTPTQQQSNKYNNNLLESMKVIEERLENDENIFEPLPNRPSGQNTHMYTKRDLGKPVRVSINNNYCLLVKQQHAKRDDRSQRNIIVEMCKMWFRSPQAEQHADLHFFFRSMNNDFFLLKNSQTIAHIWPINQFAQSVVYAQIRMCECQPGRTIVCSCEKMVSWYFYRSVIVMEATVTSSTFHNTFGMDTLPNNVIYPRY